MFIYSTLFTNKKKLSNMTRKKRHTYHINTTQHLYSWQHAITKYCFSPCLLWRPAAVSYLTAMVNTHRVKDVLRLQWYVCWRCVTQQTRGIPNVVQSSSSSSSSFYLFIKQFNKNMTADRTWTGPTALTVAPVKRTKQQQWQWLGLYTYVCTCSGIRYT